MATVTPLRPQAPPAPDAAAVLSKAVTRAAPLLGLNQAQLGRVLGLSPATASRLMAGQWQVPEDSKAWQLAALLVRVYRSLDGLTGGDAEARTAWLGSYNVALGAVPQQLLPDTEGLVRVLHYLDAARAQH